MHSYNDLVMSCFLYSVDKEWGEGKDYRARSTILMRSSVLYDTCKFNPLSYLMCAKQEDVVVELIVNDVEKDFSMRDTILAEAVVELRLRKMLAMPIFLHANLACRNICSC